MGRFHNPKQKNRENSESSQIEEGTSARTRPVSVEDIMLRRKIKKESGEVNKGSEIVGCSQGKDGVSELSDFLESDKRKKDDPVMKDTVEDSLKVSSRKKEKKISIEEAKLGGDRDKGSVDPKTKSRSTEEKHDDTARRGRTDSHGSRKRNVRSGDDIENGYAKRHSRDVVKEEDSFAERRRGKSEKETRDKEISDNNNRQVFSKRNTYKRLTGDFEDELKKRNVHKLVTTDKYADRSRGKSENESRMKFLDEDERVREKPDGRKHTSSRVQNSNLLEAKQNDKSVRLKHSTLAERKGRELSRVHHEEPRLDRRRSRSREREKEFGRRSASLSPKAHRNTIQDRNPGDFTSHSSRDRLGKSQSDINKKELSRVHNEDPRLDRRRSRSREREKDLGRRSASVSPKAHRHTVQDRDHGDFTLQSSRDRLGKSHSDVNKKKMSNNGSGNHYRHHGGTTRLGGYSPRKRKSEAAAKTPSPTGRPSEARTAGWDLPPAGPRNDNIDSSASDVLASKHTVPLSTNETPGVLPATPSAMKPSLVSFNTPLAQLHAIDSIQLTQSTRPLRRLYVENLPASVSEKDVMECINSYLLASGVNRIHGSQPCISCMIHKEKAQALLEFLTPEDASAALSFDGRSFAGSILRLRRPKDYVEVTTGVPEKSVAAVDSISDVVDDSPHKIFIGGVSEVLSPKMLMEIAGAFGPLKAYRFMINGDRYDRCAFLEYVDHSVTLKACAGLNGMRLGGQVLTVVQAFPDTSVMVNVGKVPSYGIPEHAKPLLEKPTQVLMLKNMLELESFLSLSETKMEDLLEDVRIECARFGTVKSINVVKHLSGSTPDTTEVVKKSAAGLSLDSDSKSSEKQTLLDEMNPELGKVSTSETANLVNEPEADNNNVENDSTGCDQSSMLEPSNCATENENFNKPTFGSSRSDDQLRNNLMKDEAHEPAQVDFDLASKEKEHNFVGTPSVVPGEGQLSSAPLDTLERSGVTADDGTTQNIVIEDNRSNESALGLESEKTEAALEFDDSGEGENRHHTSKHGDDFLPGCVLVEFRRAEASCMAAHCLHGRLFEDRTVMVEYVSHDIYQKRFPK